MKSLKLLLLLVLSPLTFFAQKQLSGLWMGSIGNDSTTIRKDQDFELVLAEYRGKVTGYSRSTFIVNDTLFYIVKRVKGTIEGDLCEIKDDEIISHNFSKRIDKGVKMISTFYRNNQDSVWYLKGDWKTNQTKKYYSLTGRIDLKEESDYTKSKLFSHLEELSLDKTVPFFEESKKTAPPPRLLARTHFNTQTQKNVSNPLDKRPDASVVKSNTVAVAPVITIDSKNETTIAAEKQDAITKQTGAPTSVGVKSNTVSVDRTIVSIDPKNETTIGTEKQSSITSGISSNQPNTSTVKSNTVAVNTTMITPEVKSPVANPGGAAAFIDLRKTIATQYVPFSSDSIVLALYDNGEIDGDTVSVTLNGELLMSKQGLKGAAIKKTIYIPAGSDELTLILYAENLGKYPPNTGLLVVYDGEDRHQVHFSADLTQNAAVIFKRKK